MHGSRLHFAAVQGIAVWAAISLAAPLAAQDTWHAATLSAQSIPTSEETDVVLPAAWQQPLADQAGDATPAAAETSTAETLPKTPRVTEFAPPGASHTQPPAPILSRSQREPQLLPPSSRQAGAAKPASGLPSLLTVAGSLILVLGLFFTLVWFLKRGNPKANAILPLEVVEVLGRAPLDGRQQLHLLRCGRKLLLVSVTPSGAETLTEIIEPTEVDRLAGLCMQARPNSATAAFRQVFQQFSDQHATAEKGDYPAHEETRHG